MSSINQCLASLARLRLTISASSRPSLQSTPISRCLAPAAITQQTRHAVQMVKKKPPKPKKKIENKTFGRQQVHRIDQYTLCDAIRYFRAAEVGRDSRTVKYELAVSLSTPKAGPVLKSRVALPHNVRTDRRIAVICPEDSPLARTAKAAGASAVGESSIFETIRSGNFDYTAVICHSGSVDKLQKAQVGRILGPRGLMPSAKQGTVTSDIVGLLQEMSGSDQYREKDGVVRMAIGQLAFTPEMLSENITAFIAKLKEDCKDLEDQVSKTVHEVVLSTTHGPGISLNGRFKSDDENVTPDLLVGPL